MLHDSIFFSRFLCKITANAKCKKREISQEAKMCKNTYAVDWSIYCVKDRTKWCGGNSSYYDTIYRFHLKGSTAQEQDYALNTVSIFNSYIGI